MPITVRLTATGTAKLARIVSRVVLAGPPALAGAMGLARAGVARRAPSPEEEAEVLSSGVAETGASAGQVVGTPTEGRFIRTGGNIPLREAILQDPIQTAMVGDLVVTSSFGNPTFINGRTGFSWIRRGNVFSGSRGGEAGPTYPFNRAWVQAAENGGAVWFITPRYDEGSRLLGPEPGVFTTEMTKTVRPYGMYRGARFTGRALMAPVLTARLRQTVQVVSRGTRAR